MVRFSDLMKFTLNFIDKKCFYDSPKWPECGVFYDALSMNDDHDICDLSSLKTYTKKQQSVEQR
jgi:hypothetical protein